MSRWDQDTYAKAWHFATVAHQGQTYGGPGEGERIAYINHLASVAMEVMWALQAEPGHDENLAIQCALLHDTLEDTSTTPEILTERFGDRVAAGVQALSKNPDVPKNEQLADSLRRIRLQPREIWMVKLADRITNLYCPPFYWNNDKIISYRTEAMAILEHLAPASPSLADRLHHKISHYLIRFCVQ
jgi:(p)ppGpp synthase/HD superfamily hydrolase